MIRRQLVRCLHICALLVLPFAAAGSDGTGKFHMGRESAKMMPAQDAAWLERNGRERRERPDLLLLELGLEPTMVVADIGAGTGYLTRRLAAPLPRGTVYAVEVQPEMGASLRTLSQQPGMSHVVPVLGTVDATRLGPGSLDLADGMPLCRSMWKVRFSGVRSAHTIELRSLGSA
jgi:hypothetical protein